MNKRPIMEYFPKEYSPRECQKEALLHYEALRSEGYKKFVFLGETGSGKSLVARTILEYEGDGYFVTANKALQNQYYKDFSELPMVKGKSNFNCIIPGNLNTPVNQAPCARNKIVPCTTKNYESGKHLSMVGVCPYYKQIEIATDSPKIICNYHVLYFIRKTNQFYKRKVAIFDECHNNEKIMQAFTGTIFPKKEFPELDLSSKNPEIIEQLFDKVSLNLTMLNQSQDLSSEEAKTKQKLENYLMILEHIKFEDKKNLVIWNPELSKSQMRNRDEPDLAIKPIFVGDFSRNFSESCGEVLCYFSATVNYKEFCFANGFDPDEVAYIEMPSDFPPEESPIIEMFSCLDLPTGVNSFNWRTKFDVLAAQVDFLEEILEQIKDQRVLIHTHSLQNEEHMKKNIKAPFGKTLIYGMDYDDKDEAIEEFKNTPNSVLFSYSSYEGIDLPDDLCRVIIFLKIPYLPMVDPWVKARSNYSYPDSRKNNFYAWQTCQKIIQGVSRHIRNNKDWGVSILLDNPKNILKYNYDLFPRRFIERFEQSDQVVQNVVNRVIK